MSRFFLLACAFVSSCLRALVSYRTCAVVNAIRDLMSPSCYLALPSGIRAPTACQTGDPATSLHTPTRADTAPIADNLCLSAGGYTPLHTLTRAAQVEQTANPMSGLPALLGPTGCAAVISPGQGSAAR